MQLKGKRALVTGAGKGIGRGIAMSLAKAGSELFLHYRSDLGEAESLLAEITQMGGIAHIFCADLANDNDRDAMFAEIKSLWDGLDIAVNNAGWDPGYMQFDTISPDLYYRLSDINIKNTLFCCLKEIKLMRNNQSGGSIINIGLRTAGHLCSRTNPICHE